MTGFPPGGGPVGPGGYGAPGGYGPAAQRPGPPAPPPPPPAGGYPPAPYQPSQPPQQGQQVASPHRSRGSSSGVIASLIALLVIVGGVLATVLLATSDANKKVPVAGVPSGRTLPSGAQLPSGARSLPSGVSTLPSGATGLPSATVGSLPGTGVPGVSTGYSSAADLGDAYFSDLAAHLYYTSRGLWCVPSLDPLTPTDVDSVVSAVSQGPIDPSAASTSVPGSVSLNDGSSGTLTIDVQQQSDGSYCITHQSTLS